MRSLWTKFFTGIAVVGTVISAATTASAGGNKFSFGGSGNSGNSMRARSLSSSSLGSSLGSNSMKFTQRSLTNNAFKIQSFSGANGLGQAQFKPQNLSSRNLQLNRNLSTQILGNSNKFKGLNQVGSPSAGQNTQLFDRMVRSAKLIEPGKGLNTLNVQGLNRKLSSQQLFGGTNKHNLGLFVGQQGSQKSAFCAPKNKCGVWWDWCGPSFCKPHCYPWWYDSYCYPYYCYPYYYGCYPYRQITYQVLQPDLALVDVRMISMGNGVDEAPLVQITIVNRGQATSGAFQIAVVAAASKEQLETAVKAAAQVGPIRPSQTTNVVIRLPLEALAIPGPTGVAPFQLLAVAVDELNQVVESNELNNRGLVDRDTLQMADGAVAASVVQQSTVARQVAPPPMISLPRQF